MPWSWKPRETCTVGSLLLRTAAVVLLHIPLRKVSPWGPPVSLSYLQSQKLPQVACSPSRLQDSFSRVPEKLNTARRGELCRHGPRLKRLNTAAALMCSAVGARLHWKKQGRMVHTSGAMVSTRSWSPHRKLLPSPAALMESATGGKKFPARARAAYCVNAASAWCARKSDGWML
ncbi:hypothetical protein GUJ93_ZPchr0004g40368 [Zizania palustris]|uniref:Uncharacterized protein n=1 Tax=Zizania palustris TaxID=103762 RepID=A0A8J5T0P1_ZIZPA|nr:hypothetical protein GUJ93_ZPchr0004g40368 [Zizania palustris]